MAGAYSSERSAEPAGTEVAATPDKSLGELFSTMTAELGTLVHQEIELAKVETKEEVSHVARAADIFGGAALSAHMAWLFGSLALAWLLDHWMNRVLAFAVVGFVYALAAGVLFASGRARARQIDPVPRQTVETLKKDTEWARAQKS